MDIREEVLTLLLKGRTICQYLTSGCQAHYDLKSVSNLSPNNKPIMAAASVGQCKFPATISLYGACSEDVLVQRSLEYYSESGYHRMRVDRRIRFEYATCGRGNF